MTETSAKPYVTVTQAAELLGMSVGSVRAFIAREIFTITTPSGTRCQGSKIYLRADELKIFADKGERFVIEFRKQRDRSSNNTRKARKS